jgi:hypothetical protein
VIIYEKCRELFFFIWFRGIFYMKFDEKGEKIWRILTILLFYDELSHTWNTFPEIWRKNESALNVIIHRHSLQQILEISSAFREFQESICSSAKKNCINTKREEKIYWWFIDNSQWSFVVSFQFLHIEYIEKLESRKCFCCRFFEFHEFDLHLAVNF